METIMTVILLAGWVMCSPNERILTLLRSDKKFRDEWHRLLKIQEKQVNQQSDEFNKLENSWKSLRNCEFNEGFRIDHSDNLRPADIELYAELGHLSYFCEQNFEDLARGELDSCHHPGYTTSLPSLDKLFSVFNPNITIIKSSTKVKLSGQRADLLTKFEKNEEWKNKWKLIAIMPSIEDGEMSEYGQSAIEVMETIEELHRTVPFKTFIVVVRSSGQGLWQDAFYSNMACRSLLERWQQYSFLNQASIWDQVEKICDINFQKYLFSVQILPLLENSSLIALSGVPADLSILGYDCAHFSARGLSLFHIAIWNSIVTRNPDRVNDFAPTLNPPICVDPRCPYIRTRNNSVFCLWNSHNVEADNERFERISAIVTLAIALILLTIIVLSLMCGRRSNRIKHADENAFKKPVGADWESIKYIDEESSKDE